MKFTEKHLEITPDHQYKPTPFLSLHKGKSKQDIFFPDFRLKVPTVCGSDRAGSCRGSRGAIASSIFQREQKYYMATKQENRLASHKHLMRRDKCMNASIPLCEFQHLIPIPDPIPDT